MKYDLILKGGRIVDKAFSPDRVMDIGVAGEAIAEVGPDLNPQEARRVIDVTGFLVSPGLIDCQAPNDLEIGIWCLVIICNLGLEIGYWNFKTGVRCGKKTG